MLFLPVEMDAIESFHLTIWNHFMPHDFLLHPETGRDNQYLSNIDQIF
jgi:hypothetical protein